MKKLLFLLVFIPLVSFGQSYKDLMSIKSVDMFKKVAIENGYEYDGIDGDWIRYGFDVTRDSTNTIISRKIFTSYNTKDHRWSFQIPMTYKSFFGVNEETENASTYYSIIKEIKANCKYYKILNYKEDDYVSYSCSESSYKGKIGFVISEGWGIIRHFPEE